MKSNPLNLTNRLPALAHINQGDDMTTFLNFIHTYMCVFKERARLRLPAIKFPNAVMSSQEAI